MIYDLIVVGNGIAAQTFLFELFNALDDVKNSQNYSVAQIFADEISPPCSLNTTATVSLAGIEEGVSPLGDELRTSYYLFENFYKKHNPDGVEPITQLLTSTNPKDEAKLLRRYKSLIEFNDPHFKTSRTGFKTDSFHISPMKMKAWFEQFLNQQPLMLKRIKQFVRRIQKNKEGNFECVLMNGELIVAKKMVLATGAYSKIFASFYHELVSEEMNETEVLAGSYLERTVDLNRPSFFITIDNNKCVYKSLDKNLVLGSVSEKGSFLTADLGGLDRILNLFNTHLSFSLGELKDFRLQTGLRHKGKKRRPIFRSIDESKNFFMISGLYKNGFTFSHLAAQKILKELNL